MRTHQLIRFKPLAAALVAAGTLISASTAVGFNKFVGAWQDLYPASNSDRANCQLCHGTSTSTLNAYGADLCLAFGDSVPKDIAPYLQAIETEDSDEDESLANNKAEIDGHYQPGWRAALDVGGNPLFSAATCLQVAADTPVPTNVPQPYDPPTTLVAIVGGPYTGIVGDVIRFDGSGSQDPNGTIGYWDWDFGDGGTATGEIVSYTYQTPGTYTVTLTVTDNEANTASATTTATIAPKTPLDLDIVSLGVPKNTTAGLPIAPTLEVSNNGGKLGQALANVTGDLNGVRVYSRTLYVFDGLEAGTTTFTFAPYTPTAAGTMVWTATISDEDPDPDVFSVSTKLRK